MENNTNGNNNRDYSNAYRDNAGNPDSGAGNDEIPNPGHQNTPGRGNDHNAPGSEPERSRNSNWDTDPNRYHDNSPAPDAEGNREDTGDDAEIDGGGTKDGSLIPNPDNFNDKNYEGRKEEQRDNNQRTPGL